ncbi:hypothetical protein SAMN05444362_101662 [Dysgonomonas macrotermitis]|uniref:Uncharacterized protein n=1 Tax=Dysgonomonas macrotermitis TaxID=1346286 RepID=A0A1M4UPS2_9BACT|nr:hypothetical protein SAMN05444362_101662 [Dysgonomonas macrotermitis]
MSRSIHITIKNFRGLTKQELEKQHKDKNSDLNLWAKKKGIKRAKISSRKK